MTQSQLIKALQAYSTTGDPAVKVKSGDTWIDIREVELDPDSNTLLIDMKGT